MTDPFPITLARPSVLHLMDRARLCAKTPRLQPDWPRYEKLAALCERGLNDAGALVFPSGRITLQAPLASWTWLAANGLTLSGAFHEDEDERVCTAVGEIIAAISRFVVVGRGVEADEQEAA